MRSSLQIFAPLLLSACATWRTAPTAATGPVEPASTVLAIQDFTAVELSDVTIADGTLSGLARRGWVLPEGASSAERFAETEESPDELALALGWKPVALVDGEPTRIAVSSVRQLRRYEPHEARTAGLVIVIVLGSVLAVTGLGYLVVFATVACGRPLRVRGKRVITPLADGRDWIEETPIAPVEAAIRGRLAEIWTEEARAEHAAVAAFSKLALELIAVGAPPGLVKRATRAAMQEVTHARLCFGLASAYGGEPLGPGPLPEALAGDTPSVSRLATESIIDGCLREGIAAEIARLGAESARDPAVARVLRIQARDEARHAELGWSIVEWCVAREGESLRPAIERAIDAARLPRVDDIPEHGRIGRAVIDPIHEALRASARARVAKLFERSCRSAA